MLSKVNPSVDIDIDNIEDFGKSYRKEKALQVFIVSEVALFLAIIIQLFNSSFELAGILSAVLLILAGAYWKLKDNHINAATTVLILCHTILATYLMWRYGGIRDEVMFAFPMILIFATVLASTKLVTGIFLFIVGLIFANAYVNVNEIYLNYDSSINLESATIINLLLLVIFISTFIGAQGIKKLISDLVDQNEELNKSKREVQKLVYQDALTGLPNRVMARRIFDQYVETGNKNGSKTALLFIDLDDFKSINDSLGHQIGDEFLILIARRIAGMIGGYGSVYRLGGDEFLVLLNDFSNTDDVINQSERLGELLNQALKIKNYELSVSCSIGIAIAPDHAADFDTALKYADIALYQAKKLGRNRISLIDDEMIVDAQEDFSLLEDLRKAIKADALELYYQPKIDIQQNQIIGAEALLRWQHQEKGFISPEVFIPLAEKSGLINRLGHFVLETSIKHCAKWHEMGFIDYSVSVNVSPIQFYSPDFSNQVMLLLNRYRLLPEFLELEITENVLIEQSEALTRNIQSLKRSGVKLSIDDFGKGYSNLAYIKRLNVHAIKIDREYIMDLDKSEDDLAIVKAITDIAKRLNIKLVAEGVESQSVLDTLVLLNCDYAQGYHWSPAIKHDDFVRHIMAKRQESIVAASEK
ncbi:bifunctional diguanylate cyclase/phosphodiesterase [Thalassotalea sp. Y01]|uniref:putative bifunctional diguanylate cyclase/phosphodiesterase n=1 Tax=Thalassotalea sp. Y01 TaxID=2729613 RepID=UPI00145D057A|nr:bifunctional diguanylate cyclase/phosphodiesterase [Thalassotalea sp. Y01]NMP17125.1 bifunctional diguanylate cyclase/phosphodiesterase [Thalassotalea sp. Y01]